MTALYLIAFKGTQRVFINGIDEALHGEQQTPLGIMRVLQTWLARDDSSLLFLILGLPEIVSYWEGSLPPHVDLSAGMCSNDFTKYI